MTKSNLELILGTTLLCGTLVACSGGGGSSAPGPILNQGSYTVDAFDYVDPQSPGFHPLGTTSSMVNELSEQMVVIPYDKTPSGYGTGGDETLVWVDEGPLEGAQPVQNSLHLFGEDLAVRGAAAGNLDDDGAKEWVATAITHSGTRVSLYSADRHEDGTVDVDLILSFDPGPWSIRDTRVELADLDGDFRDEIIVVARSNYFSNNTSRAIVRVYDDPESGAAQLMNMDRNGGHVDIWGLPADVIGDERPEVVVSLGGDSTNDGAHCVRLYKLDEGATSMERVHNWIYLTDDNFTEGVKPAIGDFDGDGKDEIVTGKSANLANQFGVLLHEWREDGSMTALADVTLNSTFYWPGNIPLGDHYWKIIAFERQVGKAELALIAPHLWNGSYHPWRVTLFGYHPVSDSWSQQTHLTGQEWNGQYPALCAGDINADGTEELQWGLVRGYLTEATLWRGYLRNDGAYAGNFYTVPPRHFFGNLQRTRPPVLVSGDWDADGLVVQYTGFDQLEVARPIPLAVMSAPPTRAGISQNYDDTTTRFETGTSTSQTWGVTSGTTLTASVGAQFSLFGLIKAGGKATIEKALTTSELETSQVSYVSGYAGSSQADTIVFQGTLNHSYEYVILSAPDPAAVGEFIRVNLPVDSLTYNWTLDYYNSQVSVEDQIGDEILTHTPGEIESYPTFGQLQNMVDGSLHWQFPSEQDVGQGLGFNDQEISFLDENTTETQRTVSIGGEGEVAFGVGVSVGGSSDSGSIYSVTYSETTSFATTVGAIQDPAQYEAWRYTWGMFIETHGRTADANNQPTGYTGDRRPFQLVRYWVDRVGGGYVD